MKSIGDEKRISVRWLFVVVTVVAISVILVFLLPEWLGQVRNLYFDGTDVIAVYDLPGNSPNNPIKTVRMNIDGKVRSRNHLSNTNGFPNFPPRYVVESRFDVDRRIAIPNSDGQVCLRLCAADYVKIGVPFLVPSGDYWLLNDKSSLLVVQSDRIQLRQISSTGGNATLLDEQKRSTIAAQQPNRLGVVLEVDPTRFVLCSCTDKSFQLSIWDPSLVELYACDSGKLRLISAWKTYSSFQRFQTAIDDGDVVYTNAAGTHLNRINSQDGTLISSLDLPIQIAGGGFDYSPYYHSERGFWGLDYDKDTGTHAYDPKTFDEIPLSPAAIQSDSELTLLFWDKSRNTAWYYDDFYLFAYQREKDEVLARIKVGFRMAQYTPEVHRLDKRRILVLSDNDCRWWVLDLENRQVEKSVKMGW